MRATLLLVYAFTGINNMLKQTNFGKNYESKAKSTSNTSNKDEDTTFVAISKILME